MGVFTASLTAMTLLLGAGATQAPLQAAALQKLEAAAEICRRTGDQPPAAFAEAAAREGFQEKPERNWWQWDSGIVGPSIVVTQQPGRCRVVMIPAGLTRQQVVDAVFAWADEVGFEAYDEPASDEPDVSLVTGYLDGLGFNLWASGQGNFIIDLEKRL